MKIELDIGDVIVIDGFPYTIQRDSRVPKHGNMEGFFVQDVRNEE